MGWLVLWLLLTICLKHGQVQGQTCDLTSLPRELVVTEGAANGTVLLTTPGQENLELVRFNSPTPPPFIGLHDGTLYLNHSFQLDTRQVRIRLQKELCNDFENQGLQWKVFLRCQGQFDTHTISINVKLTDDFPPEFTTSFSAKIQEMGVAGSQVVAVRSGQVGDRDCAGSPQLGITTLFSIQAGNRNEAFALPNPRSGRIVVNRLLDYETGDRHFVLNISVSDVSLPERKSYTTLEVTVLDIDDNDPVFDHPHYSLHVPEEDTSLVGVWVNTEPPISVSDPDKNVTEKDPLLIRLYNEAADASVVEVNSSTGQVRLKTALDREQQSSYPVVLKVQQTVNWRRSSSTTVTIVVDDVNDHAPLFSRPAYDVSVAEHSPLGTSVVMVLASDADVGDNANFTYTLESGEEAFSLVDTRFGENVYGLVLVRNSSLLDREISPQITLTIGTEERAGSRSQGCQGDRCQVKVNVTLLDINDHDPVFDRQRYVFRVNGSGLVSSGVLATVRADDADSGPNADVTYSMSEVGAGRCDDVTIDDRSGDVSLAGTGTTWETCTLMVTACDNPSDLSQRRCSTVPVQVIADSPEELVLLEAPGPAPSLLAQAAPIGQELGVILNAAVTVRHIQPASVPNRSSVSISATNMTSQEVIPRGRLQALVEAKREAIAAMFRRYLVVTSSPEDDDRKKDDVFSPLFIALVVIIAALLVAVFVASVIIIKSRRKNDKQHRLIQHFSSSLHLYDNADSTQTQNDTPTTTTISSNTTTISSNATSTNNTALLDISSASNLAPGSVRDSSDMARANSELTDTDGAAAHTDTNRYRGVRVEATLAYDADEHVLTGRGRGTSEAAPPNTDSDREVRAMETNPETDSGLPSDREFGVEESSQEMTPVLSRREPSSSSGEDPTHPDTRRGAGSSSHSVDAVRTSLAASSSQATWADPSHPCFNTNAAPQGHDQNESEDTLFAGLGDPHSQRHGHSPTTSPEEDLTAVTTPGHLPRPATPPKPPLSRTRAEDEDTLPEEPESEDILPEEPEPDYAKKVRFSASIVQKGNQAGGVTGGLGEGREPEAGTGDCGHPLGHPSTIATRNGDAVDSVNVFWTVDEEMTAL